MINFNEAYKDILTSTTQVVVITTNGYIKRNGEAVMGRGIAREIATRMPDIPKILGKLLATRGNHVHILQENPNQPVIVSFPVKPHHTICDGTNVVRHLAHKYAKGDLLHGWACKADPNIIERSTIELLHLVNQRGWTDILMPRVGCGAGELSYEDIRPLLNQYLDKRFTVCTFNPNTKLSMHSGGALGADTQFGLIANNYPINQYHWFIGQRSPHNAPNGNIEVDPYTIEIAKREMARAGKLMYEYKYTYFKDPRILRNYCQVIHSNTIYAVGTIANKGERAFPNLPNDTRTLNMATVTGGTGYAIALAILLQKPIYVYCQTQDNWFTYNYEHKGWFATKPAKITGSFAGIGTREITPQGIQAIKDLFHYSFDQ